MKGNKLTVCLRNYSVLQKRIFFRNMSTDTIFFVSWSNKGIASGAYCFLVCDDGDYLVVRLADKNTTFNIPLSLISTVVFY